ncbi:hypothetical protein CCHR01_18288 [Colletotrichum chrysophilum]|uniref:Uncharacterized protein n=1 Tax=Colletotrichum chrysophilum TaxID=1836956 RepID=A0AAD9A0U2_9PEZI|nr:hypothetical protein CCHR01_18288 [Colletotrichum chrysophilum]
MTGLVDKTHIRCRTNQTTEIHHPPLTISSTELKVQGHLNNSRRMSSLNNILRGWWQELLWLWISVLAFVILVVLLNAYDNQPLPQWPSGITLNTAVASLATIARTALTIPVAEGLSQSKWSWFKRKPRPLKDFDMFDQASRGPWGSLTLLVRTKGRFIGVIAALLLTSGIATSTLTQSTVAYSTRNVPIPGEGHATAWRLPSYWLTPQNMSTSERHFIELQALTAKSF